MKTNGTMISMHQVYRERRIPWATTRRSVKRIFQEKQLRFFRVKGKRAGARPTYYTTSVWLNTYLRRVKASRHI